MSYIPIRVSTLRGDRKIPFDAFIHIAGKYILYCRKGDSFEGERLERLRKKNLERLYVQEDADSSYRSYLVDNIDQAYDSTSSQPIESRAEVIQGVQQAAVEDLMECPEAEELYNTVGTSASRYVDFIINEKAAINAVLKIKNSNSNIAHHGVNVATLAMGIAEKLGVGSGDSIQLETLTVGCLLHDIGHLENDLDIGRPISTFTREELATYKQHPDTGASKVRLHKHFSPDVIRIINEHEEDINGGGFPKRLTEAKIHPLALICGLANTFDRLTSFENVDLEAARKQIQIDGMGVYPLSHLKALVAVLVEHDVTGN